MEPDITVNEYIANLHQQRDQAVATLARVQAILDGPEPSLIASRVRAALKEIPAIKEDTRTAFSGSREQLIHVVTKALNEWPQHTGYLAIMGCAEPEVTT